MSVIYGNPITLGGGGVKGKKLSELTEGSLISVLEDGKLVPFYVAKHNYEADLNGEGRTLLVRKNLHSTGFWNTTGTNTYVGSTIDNWLNNNYAELLSSTVRANFGTTKFEYTIGGGNNSVANIQRDIFVLSVTELGITDSRVNIEGEALPIASILRDLGAAQHTRSPSIENTTLTIAVLANGTAGNYDAKTDACGYRPCFTLPANMALNTEPYADGSWGLADEYDGNIASPTKKPGVDYISGIVDLDVDVLNTISNAISNNKNINSKTSVVYYSDGGVHREISTGDTIGLEIDGTSYLFDVVGFNHDNLVNASAYGAATATGKAGITFQMHTVLPTTYQMNASATNSGGYDSSAMHTTHLPALLAKMSEEVRGAIKQVTKLSSAGGKSTTIEAIPCNLFLLSEVEVAGYNTNSAAGEGSQYAYYAAGNSALKEIGSNNHWWERSPNVTSTTIFCCVNNTGAASGGVNANYSIGVAFALCI